MNDFPALLKSSDIESARAELLENYKAFCADNPLLLDIQETTSLEELKNICLFMNSLSVLFAQADFLNDGADFAAYVRGAAAKLRTE